MRKPQGRALDGLLQLATVTAAGALMKRIPMPGVARLAATPLVFRLARNRRVRNAALALAAIGLVVTLLSDRPDAADEEWAEAY
jgi:hypothetical protein